MTDWVKMRAASHDIVGEPAVQLAQMAYLRAQWQDRPIAEQDDIREFICLARGWEFRR